MNKKLIRLQPIKQNDKYKEEILIECIIEQFADELITDDLDELYEIKHGINKLFLEMLNFKTELIRLVITKGMYKDLPIQETALTVSYYNKEKNAIIFLDYKTEKNDNN